MYWAANVFGNARQALYMEGFPIVPIEQPGPRKTVTGGSTNSDNTANTLAGRYQEFEFQVSAYKPFTVPNYRYTRFQIIDDIPDVLNIKEMRVTNEAGSNVSCERTNVTSGCQFYIERVNNPTGASGNTNRVLATKRNPEASAGGSEWTMHIRVQVEEGADLSAFRQPNGTYVIPNVGRISYDMQNSPNTPDIPSNNTNTTINPPPTNLASLLKTVTDIDEVRTTENTLIDRYEPFTFELTANVPARHPSYRFRTFEIIDQIEEELLIDNTNVRVTRGTQTVSCTESTVTEECIFIISIENNRVLARARTEHINPDPLPNGDSAPAPFYDNVYILHIPVRVREGASLEKFLNRETNVFNIPNVGNIRYTILGPTFTNVPSPETNTRIIRPLLNVAKRSERVEYTINEIASYIVEVSQTRETATARNVVITDRLPDAVNLIPSSVRVQIRTIEDNNAVYQDIEGLELSTTNNTITAIVPSLGYGETVVITYNATVLSTGSHINTVTVICPDTEEIIDEFTVIVIGIGNPQTHLASNVLLIIAAITGSGALILTLEPTLRRRFNS